VPMIKSLRAIIHKKATPKEAQEIYTTEKAKANKNVTASRAARGDYEDMHG